VWFELLDGAGKAGVLAGRSRKAVLERAGFGSAHRQRPEGRFPAFFPRHLGFPRTALMDDGHFQSLLEFLRFSWSGYRKVRKGAKKRIVRHMQALGCREMSTYLARLAADAAVRSACEKCLTVPISRFFRDRRLWDTLQAQLPQWVGARPPGASYRVWSAGCARGEEAYSFKILWTLLASQASGMSAALELLGSDLNPDHLATARRGVYAAASLREMRPAERAAGLTMLRGGRHWVVRPAIRQGILWRVHDLRAGPPGGPYDLIFLRNSILTYLAQPGRSEAFAKVLGVLAPGGILVIGGHERLPLARETLRPIAGYRQAFQAPVDGAIN
jgi:chemotaxis methyl-accepting protein methylase